MPFSNEIKEIADFYGSKQLSQLAEECCELAVACNHFSRGKSDSKNELIGEIADVEIMIFQIKYLLDCELDVQKVMDAKIIRQLKRMESEEK